MSLNNRYLIVTFNFHHIHLSSSLHMCLIRYPQILMGTIWLPSLGGKGGAVVRALASHQCGPGSNAGVDAICGLSLLLVLSLVPRGFSPGTPVFPSPQNPTLSNSNSIWNVRTRLKRVHKNS